MSKTNTNAVTPSIKLSGAQLAMLSIAAKHEDRCLAPPPSLRGAQIAKSGEKLIAAGYVREVKAKASVPIWRRDSATGSAFALKLTSAGIKVAAAGDELAFRYKPIDGVEKLAAREEAVPLLPTAIKQAVDPRPTMEAPSQIEPRATSKIASVIGLLSRAEGATLAELIAATGWLPHTTRAALTGLRKRGYVLMLDRSDGQRGSVYRIEARADRRVEPKAAERATEVA
jgi:DNA-binding MarR family transcriptional regulator